MVCVHVYPRGYILYLSLVVSSYLCDLSRQSIMLFKNMRPLKFIDWDCMFIFSLLFMPISVSCILKLSLVIAQFRILKSSWWKKSYQNRHTFSVNLLSWSLFVNDNNVISPTLCWILFSSICMLDSPFYVTSLHVLILTFVTISPPFSLCSS